MKQLTIRQMRGALGRLDQLVAVEGEIVVTRRGRPLARIVPVRIAGAAPSHADLRASMPRLRTPSEALVRADRDER
jgi:prevent-host-death family protein